MPIPNTLFWTHVDKTPGHGPNGDCWIWTAAKNRAGYGVAHATTGANLLAHRGAYSSCVGDIPSGFHVCHHCDNPACVRPDHLFLGTDKDNVDDMVSKGRHGGSAKTHCPNGHPYDAENTRMYQGRRYCRGCRSAWRPKTRRRGRVAA